jgi:hypothetical protein
MKQKLRRLSKMSEEEKGGSQEGLDSSQNNRTNDHVVFIGNKPFNRA